jgi:(1->4)-alpha-D-glucan 1-alpha-D-glucosylmutase
VYQGCELWDLSLADPDNRRPVDFGRRAAALKDLAAGGAEGARLDEVLAGWRDGRVKLHVTSRLLGLRRDRPLLFRDGEYLPLDAEGQAAERLVCFARRAAGGCLLVVTPRLVAPLLPDDSGLRIPAAAWHDTRVRLPDQPAARVWRDVFSGETIHSESDGSGRWIAAADALARFPVAALLAEKEEAGMTGSE